VIDSTVVVMASMATMRSISRLLTSGSSRTARSRFQKDSARLETSKRSPRMTRKYHPPSLRSPARNRASMIFVVLWRSEVTRQPSQRFAVWTMLSISFIDDKASSAAL
jgi:hypothetical protein